MNDIARVAAVEIKRLRIACSLANSGEWGICPEHCLARFSHGLWHLWGARSTRPVSEASAQISWWTCGKTRRRGWNRPLSPPCVRWELHSAGERCEWSQFQRCDASAHKLFTVSCGSSAVNINSKLFEYNLENIFGRAFFLRYTIAPLCYNSVMPSIEEVSASLHGQWTQRGAGDTKTTSKQTPSRP